MHIKQPSAEEWIAWACAVPPLSRLATIRAAALSTVSSLALITGVGGSRYLKMAQLDVKNRLEQRRKKWLP